MKTSPINVNLDTMHGPNYIILYGGKYAVYKSIPKMKIPPYSGHFRFMASGIERFHCTHIIIGTNLYDIC